MTLEDVAALVLADQADLYPPKQWASEFDQAHSYIPDWVLAGDKPHERFIARVRAGHENLSRAFHQMIVTWCHTHPECPEFVEKLAEVKAAWAARKEDPDGWKPYQQYLDDHSQVPY